MLDKGQEDDWLGSRFITTLAVLAAVGLIAFVIWEWFYKSPIVEVRLFRNLNFLAANGMMFVLGILYFASLVMMPLFLQSLMGYSAESAGLLLSGGGLVLLFLMPIVGVLSSKFQARYLIAFGWLVLSIGMYLSSRQLDLAVSFRSAAILRIAQVFGLPFLFVPINLASYVGMPAEKSTSVAGLVNFMRNIGSSIGTSLVATLLERRAQVHQVYLVANVTRGRPEVLNQVASLTARLMAAGMNAERAGAQANEIIFRNVIAQASTLAYLDTFFYLAVASAIMFFLAFALKKNQPGVRRIVAE